jgi:hypothetical protein
MVLGVCAEVLNDPADKGFVLPWLMVLLVWDLNAVRELVQMGSPDQLI